MATDKIQVEVGIPEVAALNRIADAIERLADAYLYCNHPGPEEGEELSPGQSLSDVGLSG